MVNVGILGCANSGKADILRLFAKQVTNMSKEDALHKNKDTILKNNLISKPISSESGNTKRSTASVGSRLVFRIGNSMHTIFAPPMHRQSIRTIIRIARIIVAVFDLSQDLDSQLEFYSAIRFIPKTVIVALNKANIIEKDLDKMDASKKINEFKERIDEYFENKRMIKIYGFYITVIEPKPEIVDDNDGLAQAILNCVKMELEENYSIENANVLLVKLDIDDFDGVEEKRITTGIESFLLDEYATISGRCIVCLRPLGGILSKCPSCDTYYHEICFKAVVENENVCWVCTSPLDALRPTKNIVEDLDIPLEIENMTRYTTTNDSERRDNASIEPITTSNSISSHSRKTRSQRPDKHDKIK